MGKRSGFDKEDLFVVLSWELEFPSFPLVLEITDFETNWCEFPMILPALCYYEDVEARLKRLVEN